MRIAVIPARGGSKRIPQKNIKDFCGKPMIAYAIEAAKLSGLFDHIIVSTDCANIKTVALAHGAEVPFVRPEHLSDDFVGTGPVVIHAIEWVIEHWQTPDRVCCIYPTAPLLMPEDLISASDKLDREPQKSFAFSVCHYAFPVMRSLSYDEQGNICMLFPEHGGTRSQDLPESFHDAGQFYMGKTQAFLNGEPTFGAGSIPCFLPRKRVIDIDDEEDWQEAELKFQVLQIQRNKSSQDV